MMANKQIQWMRNKRVSFCGLGIAPAGVKTGNIG